MHCFKYAVGSKGNVAITVECSNVNEELKPNYK